MPKKDEEKKTEYEKVKDYGHHIVGGLESGVVKLFETFSVQCFWV